MRPRLVLVHDLEKLERSGAPEAPLKEPAPAPEPEAHSWPGSNRRDWVYRELSHLGAHAVPRAERD